MASDRGLDKCERDALTMTPGWDGMMADMMDGSVEALRWMLARIGFFDVVWYMQADRAWEAIEERGDAEEAWDAFEDFRDAFLKLWMTGDFAPLYAMTVYWRLRVLSAEELSDFAGH